MICISPTLQATGGDTKNTGRIPLDPNKNNCSIRNRHRGNINSPGSWHRQVLKRCSSRKLFIPRHHTATKWSSNAASLSFQAEARKGLKLPPLASHVGVYTAAGEPSYRHGYGCLQSNLNVHPGTNVSSGKLMEVPVTRSPPITAAPKLITTVVGQFIESHIRH